MSATKRPIDLALLRQLCTLGVPVQGVMPALLRALRWQVPCESGAFFWVDGKGEITHLYAEKMPSPDVTRVLLAAESRRCRPALSRAPARAGARQ